MELIRYRPPAPLDSYVKWLWWSRRDIPQLHCEHMLPSASAQLIFALHDEPNAWRKNLSEAASGVWTHGVVHGPQYSYFVSGPKPRGAVAGVSFHPGAAGALLGVPITELTDLHVSIDALWGTRGRSIHQRLVDAYEPKDVFKIIEQELMSRLKRPLLIHPAIAHALVDPVQGWGFTRISTVQRQTGYSLKHFIALFREAVGLTPKHYYSVQRFAGVVHALAGDHRANLAELAASLGYSDQSHLAREFREFAGVTPTQYQPRAPDSGLHHVVTQRSSRSRSGKNSSIRAPGNGRP
jgi:AraC-like DNA-binding protein